MTRTVPPQTWMRSYTLLALLLVAGFGLQAPAAVLPAFSGYSELALTCDLCDSFVNFSVYQNTDGNWTDDAFFSLSINPMVDQSAQFPAVVDPAAQYVYMYQVLNTESGMGENALRNFNISYPAGIPLTSGGFFGGVFADAAGGLLGLGNFALSNPDPALGLPGDTPNDGVPSASGIVPAGLVLAFGLNNPFLLDTGAVIASPNVAGGAPFPGIIWDFGAGSEIQPGGTSSVLFLTSNVGPGYVWAETESPGGFGAAGDVPMATPEPSSLVLLGLGLWFGGRLVRRKTSAGS